ncbi:hypothetical protein EV421DRAFT_1730890 [Armillaria borealis]|uniref:Uncharacterized protein n=1 Tax=Armillaria borealis TaxID=47425 RepID=A0AA39K5S1_9AGAR|nr:hypothetical protein EV421DRAFT_1730890 [Armillaria borealis]
MSLGEIEVQMGITEKTSSSRCMPFRQVVDVDTNFQSGSTWPRDSTDAHLSTSSLFASLNAGVVNEIQIQSTEYEYDGQDQYSLSHDRMMSGSAANLVAALDMSVGTDDHQSYLNEDVISDVYNVQLEGGTSVEHCQGLYMIWEDVDEED